MDTCLPCQEGLWHFYYKYINNIYPRFKQLHGVKGQGGKISRSWDILRVICQVVLCHFVVLSEGFKLKKGDELFYG